MSFSVAINSYIAANIFSLFPDAEDTTEVQSDDGPQCVIHYPELMNDKPSRIILLSDRSYKKLLECKNIRTELGVEACHDQCETIPVPNYDPKKDGYHRSCYMKFVKINVEDMKRSTIENCPENKMKTQDENGLDKKRLQHEDYFDQNSSEHRNQTDQNNAEREIHPLHSNNDNENHSIKHDYSGDSKVKCENFVYQMMNEHEKYSNGGKNENGEHCDNYSKIQCETVHDTYSDQASKNENENLCDTYPEAQCETAHETYYDQTRQQEHEYYSDSSRRMKHKNSENHRKTKYKWRADPVSE